MSQGPVMFVLENVSTTAPVLLSTRRHPAGSPLGRFPFMVGRLPTTTQPPGRMLSAVVRPMPPGQDIPAGRVEIWEKSCWPPLGDTSTRVVPVPCTLDLALKLLIRTSPATSFPVDVGT